MATDIGVCAAVGQNVSVGGSSDMENKKDLIIYYKVLNSDGELECHVSAKIGRINKEVTYQQAVERLDESWLKRLVIDAYARDILSRDITLDDVFIITKEEYDEIENTTGE